MTMSAIVRGSVLLTSLVVLSCAPRMRFDASRMLKVESIAPVTFIGNRVVRPPVRLGGVAPQLPTEPTMATSERIFEHGIPAFVQALRSGDRFEVVDPQEVLAADAYRDFPRLSGVNAGAAQLAEGWRLVTPEDGKKIGRLLEEVDADAALLTYWRFSLEPHTEGIGVDTAYPRTHMRAWLVDREGKVIADDEFDVRADGLIAVYNQRYDGRALASMYNDAIETCAVRLVADLSNARTDARADARKNREKHEAQAAPSATPLEPPSVAPPLVAPPRDEPTATPEAPAATPAPSSPPPSGDATPAPAAPAASPIPTAAADPSPSPAP